MTTHPIPTHPIPTLTQVVDQLVREYHNEDDAPPGHWCTTTHTKTTALAGDVCSHRDLAWLSLLARLELLVLRGVGAPAADGRTGGGRGVTLSTRKREQVRLPRQLRQDWTPGAASPAPWSPPAAELLDEIRRGSVDLANHARRVLGFGPLQVPWLVTPKRGVWVARPDGGITYKAPKSRTVYVPAIADRLGSHAALRELPRLIDALRRRDADHHLVVTVVETGAGKPARRRPGVIEAQLRHWHREALLLTGHEVPWARLTQIPNPITDPIAGPACAGRCGHESCSPVRAGRPRKWVQARCPHCGAASLRQNPATGAVVCLKPSCRDGEGRRHEWDVKELERLGLVLTTESAA